MALQTLELGLVRFGAPAPAAWRCSPRSAAPMPDVRGLKTSRCVGLPQLDLTQEKRPLGRCPASSTSGGQEQAKMNVGPPLPAAVVCRGHRRLLCRKGQQRPAADIHLLQGGCRPPISRKVIEPQCGMTDCSQYRQAAGIIAQGLILILSSYRMNF